MSIPGVLVVQRDLGGHSDVGRGALAAPRRARRGPGRRARRQAPDPRARRAQRAPGARPGEAALRAPPPGPRRRARGTAERSRPGVPPVRIECFDISNIGGTHTVASMVVFEGGAPKKSDYRRFTIRTVEGSDDFASMAEVLARRLAQWERHEDISPHDRDHDRSFASLPNVVVIDGGKGQLGGRGSLHGWLPRARRGDRLAGQAHRGGVHAGRARRSCSTTRRPSSSCCSACATRRTASPSSSPTTASGATAP